MPIDCNFPSNRHFLRFLKVYRQHVATSNLLRSTAACSFLFSSLSASFALGRGTHLTDLAQPHCHRPSISTPDGSLHICTTTPIRCTISNALLKGVSLGEQYATGDGRAMLLFTITLWVTLRAAHERIAGLK
jgi:hypothetical protein